MRGEIMNLSFWSVASKVHAWEVLSEELRVKLEVGGKFAGARIYTSPSLCNLVVASGYHILTTLAGVRLGRVL